MSEMKNENKNPKKLTASELSLTLGELDSKYITEAENYKKRVSPSLVRKFSIISAACLCLCVAIIFGTIGILNIVNADGILPYDGVELTPEVIWGFFNGELYSKKDTSSVVVTNTDTETDDVTDIDTDIDIDTDTDDVTEKRDDLTGLYATFDMIRADAEKEDKLKFGLDSEKLHFELKESGEYADSKWTTAGFTVIINCDYDMATDEDWYKMCSTTDDVSLNAAFYDKYGISVPKGDYTNIIFLSGMYLQYYLPEDFCSDFDAIKDFAKLDYVTSISIVYHFSMPLDWMAD